jgi:hypothetical protein
LSVLVTLETADEFERAPGDRDVTFSFDAEDGSYTVSLRRVVYVKRWARESRVGFGAVA